MFCPLSKIKKLLQQHVAETLKVLGYNIDIKNITIEETKNRKYGDFFTNIAFRIAKNISKDRKQFKNAVNDIAQKIAKELSKRIPDIIDEILVINGYINFKMSRAKFAKYVIEELLKTEYLGCIKRPDEKIVVEHTSANPAHPLHIGHARNAFIGDSIARIFRYCGYEVETHFYVNDCGKQIALLGYSAMKLKSSPKRVKPDHFYGVLYTIATNLLERNTRLKKLKKIKSTIMKMITKELSPHANYKLNVLKNFDRLLVANFMESFLKEYSQNNMSKIISLIEKKNGIEKELENINNNLLVIQRRWPILFYKAIQSFGDITKNKVAKLMIGYENKETEIVTVLKQMVKDILKGFLETLNQLDINYDKFVWESDLLWKGIVKEVLSKLSDNGYLIYSKRNSAVYLNARKILKEKSYLQDIFFEGGRRIPLKKVKNPPLIRRDGTTLYLLRDIAYAYYKLVMRGFSKAVNIIGIDQKLEQKYVILALEALGIKDAHKRYIHVAYELVRLPGQKMSSRRGEYITLDDIYLETIRRALNEINKRYPDYNEYQKLALAKSIAKSALKYALLAQAPNKVITFDWTRVLDFEQNSGPFIQYAHARAAAILRKVMWKIPKQAKLELLTNDEEFELIYYLAKFPEILNESLNSNRPDVIANYVNNLAILFNRFYQKHPVLKASTEDLKKARLLLVYAYRKVMAQALKLLGIKPLYKM